MKKLFLLITLGFFMGCSDDFVEENHDQRKKDVGYVVIPDIVIAVEPYQEIIFTEEEVRGSFEDPTQYGAEKFSAIYIPENPVE